MWSGTERTPMFTQKHYELIAAVMHKERKKAIDQPEQVGDNFTRNMRLEQVNTITLALCELFQKDNPKFKQFQFIAACNKDLVE
jgi:hypothetical protein